MHLEFPQILCVLCSALLSSGNKAWFAATVFCCKPLFHAIISDRIRALQVLFFGDTLSLSQGGDSRDQRTPLERFATTCPPASERKTATSAPVRRPKVTAWRHVRGPLSQSSACALVLREEFPWRQPAGGSARTVDPAASTPSALVPARCFLVPSHATGAAGLSPHKAAIEEHSSFNGIAH